EISECQGRPYFTMEYVAGPSLAEFLAGRPQDSSASAHLVETLARAMHTVHQSGLIHRDLKPANILLQNDGCRMPNDEKMTNDEARKTEERGALRQSSLGVRHSFGIRHLSFVIPKISDFGLAKDPATGPRLTQSGITLGTPSYMAPEQALNRRQIG